MLGGITEDVPSEKAGSQTGAQGADMTDRKPVDGRPKPQMPSLRVLIPKDSGRKAPRRKGVCLSNLTGHLPLPWGLETVSQCFASAGFKPFFEPQEAGTLPGEVAIQSPLKWGTAGMLRSVPAGPLRLLLLLLLFPPAAYALLDSPDSVLSQ